MILFCLFRSYIDQFLGLLLDLHLGMTPGWAWGTLYGAGARTQFGHLQSIHCTIDPDIDGVIF